MKYKEEFQRHPIEKVVKITKWMKEAVPVNCNWCLMDFLPDDKRIETEDENELRVDYHLDCWHEMLNHE